MSKSKEKDVEKGKESVENAILAQAEKAAQKIDLIEPDMAPSRPEPQNDSVETEILRSISKNVNTMADDINENEKEKQTARKEYMAFFKKLLVFLVGVVTVLIVADTFFHVQVRIEFLVSVILAILADVFAIVHTFVKYMTSMEHYEAYHKLIDSLLNSIVSARK